MWIWAGSSFLFRVVKLSSKKEDGPFSDALLTEMISCRSFTGKLAVLAAAALLLTGCPTVQKAQEGEVQQQAQASKGKIDTICVVRHQNAQLGNEKLVKAIEAGLQHTGVKTRVVEHNQVPADCRLCLFYGVTTDDKVAKSFDFQAVIDGKALQRGSGPVQPDGNIKLETVAQYAANYLQSLVNASKQNEAQQNGSEP